MITLSDFKDVATARLEDSIVLAMFDRYDGAIYLCGFSVEIALKVRITKEYGLTEFPETKEEFSNFPVSIKTHSLQSLSNLSDSIKHFIRTNREHRKKFSLLSTNWDVNHRYKKTTGVSNESLCLDLIEASEYLLKVIL